MTEKRRNTRRRVMEELRERWKLPGLSAAEVGQLADELVAALPADRHPAWMHAILVAVMPVAPSSVRAALELVARIAANPEEWKEARGAFESVRRSRLAAGVDEESPLTRALHGMIEESAKTIHNAAGFLPPFDRVAPQRVVMRLRRVLEIDEGASRVAAAVEVALFERPRKTLLRQFIREECTPELRYMLEQALASPAALLQIQTFEFNRFELVIHHKEDLVVIEDVLDVTEEGTQRVTIAELMAALGDQKPR